eukprot:c23073_g1_i2 orf=670-1992(-)
MALMGVTACFHIRNMIVHRSKLGGGAGRRKRRRAGGRSTIIVSLLLFLLTSSAVAFSIDEATVDDIQAAFASRSLTSVKLVSYYLHKIETLNSLLHAVIEVNPDCLLLAARADRQRRKAGGYIGGLHGIPILLKDNIATLDKLNTTAGSYALLGSKVPRDAGVVTRLRKNGAIILGKANLSEWANFRSSNSSSGWSARGGQTRNPYVLSATPCGSSSGSAVGVAANLVTVSLGTETDGSILCPASWNSVVGIKPTVGLTSRAGVVPVSHNQDTVGPICRTVADAVAVLDAIVGLDEMDITTTQAVRFIPKEGYKQFLKLEGLRGKRIGIAENLFVDLGSTASDAAVIDDLVLTLRKMGAEIIGNATIPTMNVIAKSQSEGIVLLCDFKQDLNSYLAKLVVSPVRTLAEVIAFNNQHASEVCLSKTLHPICLCYMGSLDLL